MKNRFSIERGQYAYTKDGRVIEISEVKENGLKYTGIEIGTGRKTVVDLNCSDIYGIAFGLDKAV